MGDELAQYKDSVFERIKHRDEDGREMWLARELQVALEYTEWRNFVRLLRKAMLACSTAGFETADHFTETTKTSETPTGGIRDLLDYELTRYACYLTVQNGDPGKEIIALGQTYFSIKTREMEIQEEYDRLSEDDKRLLIRQSLKRHNNQLSDTAQSAGVVHYGQFQDAGYVGLYNGETAGDIHRRKHLKPGEKILDWMNGEELSANLFRITQTESKIKRERISGQDALNQAHYQVGLRIRSTIQDLGGVLPEDQPTPEKSIRQLETEKKKRLRGRGRELPPSDEDSAF
jgi:DNA-damage-inducible protein D